MRDSGMPALRMPLYRGMRKDSEKGAGWQELRGADRYHSSAAGKNGAGKDFTEGRQLSSEIWREVLDDRQNQDV